MSSVNYEGFRRTIANLQERYETHLSLDHTAPRNIRDGIAESVVKCFEICHDVMWKMLRHHLIHVQGVSAVPVSIKGIMRTASEHEILPGSVERWVEYVDARIGTAHDYAMEKADRVRTLTPDFIDDAIALYEEMTGEAWEQTERST